MTIAFNLSLAGYLTALLLATANLFTKGRARLASAATIVLAGGAMTQTVYWISRWIAAGRAPFSNMFESLVLFAWTVVVVHLALLMRRNIPWLRGRPAQLCQVIMNQYHTILEADARNARWPERFAQVRERESQQQTRE